MITTLLFDFSRVLLHAKRKEHVESLNGLYREKKNTPNFRFFDYFELNGELLTYLETIRNHVQLHIFTSEDIQNAPEVQEKIKNIFGHIFSAKELRISKKDPAGYLHIAEKLGTNPQEVLFIDDTKENIENAEKAGLQTFHFSSNEKLIEKLQQIL